MQFGCQCSRGSPYLFNLILDIIKRTPFVLSS